MGSIEVFDCQQGKWVPYISTPEEVDRYYQAMLAQNEGKKKPGVLESKLRHMEDQLKETQQKLNHAENQLKHSPQVTQVTPVAQAIEMAESQLRRERKKGKGTKGCKKGLPKDSQRISYSSPWKH